MKNVNQHKSLAMGDGLTKAPSRVDKFAKGGAVPNLKSGLPTSPITDAKRANGIPGLKKGGMSKKGC